MILLQPATNALQLVGNFLFLLHSSSGWSQQNCCSLNEPLDFKAIRSPKDDHIRSMWNVVCQKVDQRTSIHLGTLSGGSSTAWMMVAIKTGMDSSKLENMFLFL